MLSPTYALVCVIVSAKCGQGCFASKGSYATLGRTPGVGQPLLTSPGVDKAVVAALLW